MPDFHYASPADIDRAIDLAIRGGQPWQAPLLQAVGQGCICLVVPTRHQVVSITRLKRSPLPTLVQLGDDDYGSTGPLGWACSDKVLRWARWFVLHGAGATVEQYRAVAACVQAHKRVVLIETSSDCLGAWHAKLDGKRGTIVVCNDGPHPKMEVRH